MNGVKAADTGSARTTESDLPPPSELVALNWGWRHSGRKAWALQDVSFTVNPGEHVLLAGASGSGKSTLLHALAGVLDADEGEERGVLTVTGERAGSPAVRASVGLVQQDPDSQIVMGNIGDEVAFGLENSGVPAEEIWPRVREALDLVGLLLPLGHSTSELSGGQKQRLALACALAMRPRVILLDEPTANLDPEGTTELISSVQQVAAQSGATVVLVEHNLDPWTEFAQRMIVLDQGQISADGPLHELLQTSAETLRESGVWVPGETVDQLLTSARYRPGEQPSGSDNGPSVIPGSGLRRDNVGSASVSCTDLAVGYQQQGTAAASGLDLDFLPGEVTCITGANGAGKTAMALTVAGLMQPVSGQITASHSLRRVRLNNESPAPTDRRNKNSLLPANPFKWSGPELLGRISMVFQEPGYQFVTQSVRDELKVGLHEPDAAAVSEQIDEYLDLLGLSHLAKAHPLSLSGGEKRRLSVATALISAPQVLVLDEPTFGQDRNTWVTLVLLLKRVAQAGSTVIVVTHDVRLIEALEARVVHLPSPPTAAEPPPVDTSVRRPLIDQVNPAVQVLGLFVMTVPLMLTVDILSAAIALACELALLPILGMSVRQIGKRIWPLLIAAPLASLSMLLYGSPNGTIFWTWGPATISQNSVDLAAAIGLRILAVGMPAILILGRIDPTRMADALTQVARLPSRIVLATLAGARMVGLMITDWRALARARRSRGLGSAGRLAGFYQGVFSLLTFALRRAGMLSVTMEARGFGAQTPRTNARASTVGPADAVMLLVCISVPTLALGMAVIQGSFRWFGL